MKSPEALPEAVFCQICGDGRGFHNLATHLALAHGTDITEYREEFKISDKLALFSKHYSQMRSKTGKAPANMRRMRALKKEGDELREETMELLQEQNLIANLITSSQASELKGVSISTIDDAIKEEHLTAGQMCLIASVEEGEECKTVAISLPPIYLISPVDLADYTPFPYRQLPTLGLREQSINGLAKQGFFTTGQVAELTGFTPRGIWKFIKSERLTAGLASLIAPTVYRGTLQTMKVSRVVSLVETEDLLEFVSPYPAVKERTEQKLKVL